MQRQAGARGTAPTSSRRRASTNAAAPNVDIRTEGDETLIEAHGHCLRIDSSGNVAVVGAAQPPLIVYVEEGGGTVAAAQQGAQGEEVSANTELVYLTGRANKVRAHFGSAMGADDFMQRLEMALYAFGFTGDNSIAVINLCRDEITNTLKTKLDQVFGAEFNVNGLGGVLTCGVTGMAAGLR